MIPLEKQALRLWVRRKIILLMLVPLTLGAGVWFFRGLQEMRAVDQALPPLESLAGRVARGRELPGPRSLGSGAIRLDPTQAPATLALTFTSELACQQVLGAGTQARWVRDWDLDRTDGSETDGAVDLPLRGEALETTCDPAKEELRVMLRLKQD